MREISHHQSHQVLVNTCMAVMMHELLTLCVERVYILSRMLVQWKSVPVVPSEADAQGQNSPRTATIKGECPLNMALLSPALTATSSWSWHRLAYRRTAISKTAGASVHRVQMASVLVCSRHFVFGQRPDVLPFPPAVCLRAVGGLQAPAALGSSYHRVCSVLLGVHHCVWGDPGGECREASYCHTKVDPSLEPFTLLAFSSRRRFFWGRCLGVRGWEFTFRMCGTSATSLPSRCSS